MKTQAATTTIARKSVAKILEPQAATIPPPNLGLIREPEVLDLVPQSSTELWRKIKANEFPAPIRIGVRAVAWKLAEVLAWIESRPRYSGPSDTAKSLMSARHPKGGNHA